jgi:glycosyltransferase involved in cell wall biosynthesis
MTPVFASDRWLYVGAFVPMANARHAGGQVAYDNLRHLRSRYDVVDAVVCTTEPESVAPAPADVRVFRQHGSDLAWYLLSASWSLTLQQMLTAPVLHTRMQRACQSALEELMHEHDYAGLFVDFTQTALLVQRAAEASDCFAPVTLCIHDVFAQRLLRSRRFIERRLTGSVLREEFSLLSSVSHVLTLSEKDRQLAQTLYALPSVGVKDFVPADWHARVRRDQAEPRALLFFANFERSENLDAARWFVLEVLPGIQLALPGVNLTLVGNGSDRLAKELASASVQGTGFVEDPSPHFSRCRLAVAPLLAGAGVKFKVLEALSCGVPVVGTPIALEGIKPQRGLTCCQPEKFAQAVLDALSSPAQLN